MKFHVYLSVVVSVLLLGVLPGCVSRLLANGSSSLTGDPANLAAYKEIAIRIADRVYEQPIVDWRAYGEQGGTVYVGGLDGRNEEWFTVAFDPRNGDLQAIHCGYQEETPHADVTSRVPRDMAEFWLRRLGEGNENPYRWTRDGSRGRIRCFSYWRSPTHRIAVMLHPRTGQLLSLRFSRLPE